MKGKLPKTPMKTSLSSSNPSILVFYMSQPSPYMYCTYTYIGDHDHVPASLACQGQRLTQRAWHQLCRADSGHCNRRVGGTCARLGHDRDNVEPACMRSHSDQQTRVAVATDDRTRVGGGALETKSDIVYITCTNVTAHSTDSAT